MEIQEMIDVLEAAKAGKVVQSRYMHHHNCFTDMAVLTFNFEDYTYRVKPEPLELNIVICPKANHGYCKCMTKCSEAKTIKVREVIE